MEDSSRLEAEVMIWKGYPARLRESQVTSSLKYKPVKGTPTLYEFLFFWPCYMACGS